MPPSNSRGKWKSWFMENLIWPCLKEVRGSSFLFECNVCKYDIKISNTFIQGRMQCLVWIQLSLSRKIMLTQISVFSMILILRLTIYVIYSKTLKQKNAYLRKWFCRCNGNVMYYLSFLLKFDITITSPFTFYCGILSTIPSDQKTNSDPI